MTNKAQQDNNINSASPNEPDCGRCPLADQCRQVWSIDRQGSLTPTGLTLASALAFLLPIITAIIAGVLATAYAPDWIIAAAAVGLVMGVLPAWLGMKLINNKFRYNKN